MRQEEIYNFLIHILLTGFFLMIPTSGYAWKSMAIEQADGDDITLPLSKNLEMSFSATHLILSNGEERMEIPKEELRNFKVYPFRNNIPTEVIVCGVSEDVSFDDGILSLSEPSEIKIFTLNGNMIRNDRNVLEVDLKNLSPSLYVIMINDRTIKIAN